jgi:hypothetical protein
LSVCCPFMPQQQNNNNVIDIKNFIFLFIGSIYEPILA